MAENTGDVTTEPGDEQQLAAELMTTVNLQSLGGADETALGRIGSEDDTGSGATLSNVHAGSRDPADPVTGDVSEGGGASQTIDLTAGGSDGFDANVSAVADTPTLSVGDITGNEDTAIDFNIAAALMDTSETLEVTISGVPSGASLSAGTDNGDGTWTLTSAEILGLTIMPSANDSSDFTLTVTATSTDGSDTASTSSSFDVTVTGVADTPTLTVGEVSGDENSPIALDISSALTDSSETLSISISGVPTGATLSAGTDNSDGSWTLDQDDLGDLTITPPADDASDFTLTVTATSTDESDEASETASFEVVVSGDGDETVEGDQNANKNDQLYGNDGEDVMYGYSGNDQLWGGTGNDTLYGGTKNDTLRGEAGNDTLYGDSGNDQLFGGDGDDTMYLGTGNDSAQGGDGDDLLILAQGDGANNSFHGGDGGGWTDTIQLQDSAGESPDTGDWTLTLTTGTLDSQGGGFMNLSQDASGTIEFNDGTELTFDGVEKIIW